jgi:putative oxidoreductase
LRFASALEKEAMANAPGLDWDLGFLRNWSAQIAFVGRLGLAFVFVVDGWQAIANFANVGDYMQANGVSARLLPLVIATKLGGGLMVVAGFASRWAAIALTGFCLLTALFFHRDSSDAEQVINFQKNIAMAGGLSHAGRVWTRGWSLDAWRAK